jgi:hypothetical protein
VTNSVTGAGIEGVNVLICPPLTTCEGTPNQAINDIAGAFRIGGIPDGKYLVILGQKDGLTPKYGTQEEPFSTVSCPETRGSISK